MKTLNSIVISIQPYWVFLIIAKQMGWNIERAKTIEVRKKIPNMGKWNKKAFIYCSRNAKSFERIPKEYRAEMAKLLGKVVGCFICHEVEGYVFADMNILSPADKGNFEHEQTVKGYYITCSAMENTCLTYEELSDYGNGKELYGMSISELYVFEKPINLNQFYINKPCLNSKFYFYCNDAGVCARNNDCDYGIRKYRLIRPPQSWCWVSNGEYEVAD